MKKRESLLFLYLTVFINMVGFGMVFPLMPFYAQTFNATPILIGLLAMSFSLVQFLTSPILGRISDKFGRKPVLITGLVAGAFSMTLMGLANSLLTLFIARAAHGAVSAAIMPTGRAYMADITTEDARVAGMGKIGAALALGFMVGPAFGSFFAGLGGINAPFFVAATISVANAILVLFFLPESLKEKSKKLVIKAGFLNVFTIFKSLRGEAGLLFIILFAWSFALSNNHISFALLVGDKFNLNATHIGYFFTTIAFVSAVTQGYLLPKIVELVGEQKTIFAGLLFMALGQILLAISPTILLLLSSFMLVGLGSALNRPTAEGIISRKARVGQGTALGVANSFESMGRIFGPLTAGFLYATTLALPFIFSAIFLLILAIAILTRSKYFP